MAVSLTHDQIRWFRLRAQRLNPQLSCSDAPAAQVVREVFALQAQDSSAAALGMRARCAGLAASAVEKARAQERSIVRTWIGEVWVRKQTRSLR